MVRLKSDAVKNFIWVSAFIGHLIIAHMLLIKTLKTFMNRISNEIENEEDLDHHGNFADYQIPGLVGASYIILYFLVSCFSFLGGDYDSPIEKINITRVPFLLKFCLPTLSVVMTSIGIYSVIHTDGGPDFHLMAFTSTKPEESGMRLVTLYLLDLVLVGAFMCCSGLLQSDEPLTWHEVERDPEEEIWTRREGEEIDVN